MIPDSVMGITFLAAGTSVPEAVSSVIVAKQGKNIQIYQNNYDFIVIIAITCFCYWFFIIYLFTGHGSMGISNSIGSNTFDILLCLGLPWLIKASLTPAEPGNYWVRMLFCISKSEANFIYI